MMWVLSNYIKASSVSVQTTEISKMKKDLCHEVLDSLMNCKYLWSVNICFESSMSYPSKPDLELKLLSGIWLLVIWSLQTVLDDLFMNTAYVGSTKRGLYCGRGYDSG